MQVPQAYYQLATGLKKYDEKGYVYVVPSSEWVVPYKLVNASLIMDEFRGATVLPWPHNLLGYVLALNGVPETTGGYLKPYFEYVVRYNLTDLLSILMHYINIKYVAVDDYVKPTTPWLRWEADIFTRQVGVEPLARFGDIRLFKVNVGGKAGVQDFLKIYKHYTIVATNLFKLLPVVSVNRNLLDTYPIVVDEVSLPIINNLLRNAYAVVIDRAGFYDLVLSELIHNSSITLLNPFELLSRGSCTGKCSIVAMRTGWGYTGRPYYPLYDGVLLLEKDSSYSFDLNLPKGKSYVVMVRLLAKGYNGYVEVNGIRKNVSSNVKGLNIYEPVWLFFNVTSPKIHIKIRAYGDMYVDCIAVTPHEEFLKALSLTAMKLKQTHTYIVLAPYELKSDRIERVKMFGLGIVAQGHVSLETADQVPLNKEIKGLYVITSHDAILVGDTQFKASNATFRRYKALYYDLGKSEEISNVVVFAPYVTGFNYIKQPNGSIVLKGFAEYLWGLPLKELKNDGLVSLVYHIKTIDYRRGYAFGIKMFHNTTHGYEVKFTLILRTDNKSLFNVALIERKNERPFFIALRKVEVPDSSKHVVNIYLDPRSMNALVLLNNIPTIVFHVNKVYGNLFGVEQWGREARMVIEDVRIIYPVAKIQYSLNSITLKGFRKILVPTLYVGSQEINIEANIKVTSLGKGSAFGIGLFHDGKNGFEIKVPTDPKAIHRVELWKREEGKPLLLNTTVLRKTINITSYKELKIKIHINKQNSTSLMVIKINNEVIVNYTLSTKLLKNVGNNIALITWGLPTNTSVRKFNVIVKLTKIRSPAIHSLNLMKISSSNGIAMLIMDLSSRDVKLSNVTTTIVYFQRYGKAWKLNTVSSKVIAHLRGLYGICNVYIVKKQSDIKANQLIDTVRICSISRYCVEAALFIFILYTAIVSILSFYSKLRLKRLKRNELSQ